MPTVPAEPTDSSGNISDSKEQNGSEKAQGIVFDIACKITSISVREFDALDDGTKRELGILTVQYISQLSEEANQTVLNENPEKSQRTHHNRRIVANERNLEILLEYLQTQNLRLVGKKYGNTTRSNIRQRTVAAISHLYGVLIYDKWRIPGEKSAELAMLKFMAMHGEQQVGSITRVLLFNIFKLNNGLDQTQLQLSRSTLLSNINLPIEIREYAERKGHKTLGSLIGFSPISSIPYTSWKDNHLDEEGQAIVRNLYLQD